MSTWVCTKCKSSWPAYTTLEAWRNHARKNKVHPGEPCSDEHGHTTTIGGKR